MTFERWGGKRWDWKRWEVNIIDMDLYSILKNSDFFNLKKIVKIEQGLTD